MKWIGENVNEFWHGTNTTGSSADMHLQLNVCVCGLVRQYIHWNVDCLAKLHLIVDLRL